jgi:hypothetical protein
MKARSGRADCKPFRRVECSFVREEQCRWFADTVVCGSETNCVRGGVCRRRSHVPSIIGGRRVCDVQMPLVMLWLACDDEVLRNQLILG